VAARRAAHQLLDRPLIFEDPLALSILRPPVAEALRRNPQAYDRSKLSRSLRTFLAIRSRFAEDEVAAAVERGVRQYVLLGAGFDTFAYRNPYPALHVFELDHPATQAPKRERLTGAGITIPASVTFAPVDLARVGAGEAMRAAGVDPARPALVAWLGVVAYLSRDDVVRTLRDVAALAPATTLVLDYGVPPKSLSWTGRLAYYLLARRVAAAGEPFRSFFAPAELHKLLAELGLRVDADLDAAAMRARYGAGGAMPSTRSGAHLLKATVG
jgi:methyltransferase (TIGR00027 family)